MTKNSPLLYLKGITKTFGGVKALTTVDLEVMKGEILALLGENGAGKSTLMKILSGGYQADSGSIFLQGDEVRIDNPVHAKEMGIGIIYQEFSLIPHMTVAENIYLAREILTKSGQLNRREMNKKAKEQLSRLGVDIDPAEKIINLSVAKKQFVEIAKAVSQNVNVLILDEPSATLTPKEVDHLFALMKELKKQSVSMIFISHHLDEIFEIADRVTVLRDGYYIGTKPVSQTNHDELVHMMVGRTVNYEYPEKTSPKLPEKRTTALNIRKLQLHKDSPSISFCLKKGEILGIAGLVGAGRTEMIRGAIGADPAYHKEIELFGKEVMLPNPSDTMKQGIGLLPEDRKTQGVILPFSVEHNITLCTLKKICNRIGLLDSGKSKDITDKYITDVKIKTPGGWQMVGNLSGGNQQKVVIAKWLNSHSRILIFDEPTRGIDVVAKTEIYTLMRALTEQGISIIMISSELPEIVGMSDRVLVMRNDDIVAELSGEEISPHNIMAFAAGGQK
jgi:ribose transport system ATP-binding protein